MRVAIITDNLFFQRQGGLQRQVLDTLSGLREIGVEAEIFCDGRQDLADFDIVHVFDAVTSHTQILTAKSKGLPVILSSVENPKNWSAFEAWQARWLSRSIFKFTRHKIKTSFLLTQRALANADWVIALSEHERAGLIEIYHADPERIEIIPNGVGKQFVAPDPQRFCERFQIKPGFVLCVGRVCQHKNQVHLARILQDTGAELVVIGDPAPGEHTYAEQLHSFDHVHYLGPIAYDDPLLPSAYAASGVFALPSANEISPLTVIEALAAGTPVVITPTHLMDIPCVLDAIYHVAFGDELGWRDQIIKLLNDPGDPQPRIECVRDLEWRTIAERLQGIYQQQIKTKKLTAS